MPDSLPPEIRRRLGLILSRLASNHDGEVVNAARLTVKMLDQHGWRPEQLAEARPGGGGAEGVLRAQLQQACLRIVALERQLSERERKPVEDEGITNAARFAQDILDSSIPLSDRERAFLSDLIEKKWKRPTEKQAAWLSSIASRMPQRGAA